MRKRLVFFLTVFLVIFYGSLTQAQDPTSSCPVFIEEALTAVGDSCASLEQNSACYGYNRVAASFVTEVDEDIFTEPSDRVGLTELRTIQTTPLDIETGAWGVAVMNVQANVPNTLPGQAVTFILLGDTEVENRVAPEEALQPIDPVDVVVSSSQRVNLRSGPGTNNNVIDTAIGGDILSADGKNEVGDWLRVTRESGLIVWIARALVNVVSGDTAELDALPVVTGEVRSPMQTFYFSTGLGTSTCFEAPNMLLIQTPKEVNQVNLTVNGAEIGVGSTVILYAEKSDYDTFATFGVMEEELEDIPVASDAICYHSSMIVLDGEALLQNDETLPLGHYAENVRCLDEEGEPIGSDWVNVRQVGQPELRLFELVELIPEALLRYPVEVPSDEAIEEALRELIPTAVPTRPPSQPQPTSPPGQTQPTPAPTTPPNQTDCSTFRATSPPPDGPVPFGNQTFYWDPTNNVDAYQIDIRSYYSDNSYAGGRLIRVGANQTNVTVDLSSHEFGEGIRITWFVQALQGSGGNFTTVCETPPRNNPIDFNSR